jgi:hypothetical protein
MFDISTAYIAKTLVAICDRPKGDFVILTLQIIFGIIFGIPVLIGTIAMLMVIAVGSIAIIRDVTGI